MSKGYPLPRDYSTVARKSKKGGTLTLKDMEYLFNKADMLYGNSKGEIYVYENGGAFSLATNPLPVFPTEKKPRKFTRNGKPIRKKDRLHSCPSCSHLQFTPIDICPKCGYQSI